MDKLDGQIEAMTRDGYSRDALAAFLARDWAQDRKRNKRGTAKRKAVLATRDGRPVPGGAFSVSNEVLARAVMNGGAGVEEE